MASEHAAAAHAAADEANHSAQHALVVRMPLGLRWLEDAERRQQRLEARA